ncbi:MAG: ABC transporter substrate-binding protein, partial [Armatimonadetes bacterium]|nr:ABC transporter substrate-binding protein [Armatimonadota bacterium]
MRSQFVALLLALLMLAGAGADSRSRAAAQAPDTLVVGKSTDILSGDPHQSGSSLAGEMVYVNLYDTLIVRDVDMRLKPGLATAWQRIDPTTWEFKLRRGVKFHNGEPFTAHAVKFSFDRGLDANSKWARRGVLRPIRSATVIDDYTVRLSTAQPWPLLLTAVARHGWIVPPKFVEKNGEQGLARRPTGTGPYRFVRWVKDERIELEANPDYWGGRPRIGRVVFRIFPNEAPRLAELLSGSVHLINLV